MSSWVQVSLRKTITFDIDCSPEQDVNFRQAFDTYRNIWRSRRPQMEEFLILAQKYLGLKYTKTVKEDKLKEIQGQSANLFYIEESSII